MSNQIIKKEKNELSELSANEVREYICRNATASEIARFQEQCRRNQLDPLKREIYLVKYGSSPAETVVGYETYLKIANRSGLLNGWKVDIDKNCTEATITIYRKDWDNDFTWTVYADEFDKRQSTWVKMKKHMLRKVAIAQGMRLCFPEELGGLPYIHEEIEVYKDNFEKNITPPNLKIEGDTLADRIVSKVKANEKITTPIPVEKPIESNLINRQQQKLLFTLLTENSINPEELKAFLKSELNIDSSKSILSNDFNRVLTFIENKIQRKKRDEHAEKVAPKKEEPEEAIDEIDMFAEED